MWVQGSLLYTLEDCTMSCYIEQPFIRFMKIAKFCRSWDFIRFWQESICQHSMQGTICVCLVYDVSGASIQWQGFNANITYMDSFCYLIERLICTKAKNHGDYWTVLILGMLGIRNLCLHRVCREKHKNKDAEALGFTFKNHWQWHIFVVGKTRKSRTEKS